MYISDILFLFWFLPISLLVYYCVPDRVREYVLLAISLLFYACGSRTYFILFLLSVAYNILLGRLMYKLPKTDRRRKALLAAGIVLDVGLLWYYKYFAPLVYVNAVLPLGISFFMFKEISYLSDIYKGTAVLNKNPLHDALYLSFFGQIESGPISRYRDMERHFVRPGDTREEPEDGKRQKRREGLFSDGCYRFIIGFNKKILLANILSNITAQAFSTSPGELSASFAWLGAVCYSMQLFFDFSGYSDMAIGLSEMFGYTCPENFNYPYMTSSISEFWRRWHITLGAWFRDYVYIPLGGSRGSSRWKVYRNLFVVWFLTGIWHGATSNFIAWGMIYFIFISLEKATGWPKKLRSRFARVLYRVFTLLLINFQWVMFRVSSFTEGLHYIRSMFSVSRLKDSAALFMLQDNRVFVCLALLFCFPVAPWIEEKLLVRKADRVIWELGGFLVNAALFILALSFVVAGENNPFAYANF